METVRELRSLFTMKEGSQAFRSILIIISENSVLSTFVIVWWGLVRLATATTDCLLTVLQLSVLTRTPSTESPLNDYNNAE
jgi:hypothetical protein